MSLVYIFSLYFCVSVQEIVHNKGVCYMYLKDPERVCKFCTLHLLLTYNLRFIVYITDSARLLDDCIHC